MDDTTLLELMKTQIPGLKALKINRYQHHTDRYDVLPSGLESLELKAVDETESIYMMLWGAWSLFENQETLKYLCLGAESNIVRWYYTQDDSKRADIDTAICWLVSGIVCEAFELELPEDAPFEHEDTKQLILLSLEVCELIGMSLTRLIQPKFFLFRVNSLKSLTLESCWGIEHAFKILATGKNERGLPLLSDLRLESFQFRYEETDLRFRAELISFLCSIPGLKHLAVLLETDYEPRSFRRVLRKHGHSLQSLVWDERMERPVNFLPENIRPRSLPIDPFCTRITDIVKYCTQLRELGVPTDWRIFEGPALLSAQDV